MYMADGGVKVGCDWYIKCTACVVVLQFGYHIVGPKWLPDIDIGVVVTKKSCHGTC